MDAQESPDDLLTAGDAARYLARKWGRPNYTTDAFKQLRHRWGLEPAEYIKTGERINMTLWRRGDLDKIPEPDRSKPRPTARHKRKTESPDESIDNAEYSMLSLA